ncbi:toll/interleukin-1 receptor domain-containing protein [Nodosilinea sp. LEGE 07088]|uniref:toll/interleukin-1 receptor domain-containing protein n=1 Tax=Nodosilinea sp. LEGE 07088 TaxID=2777968 RepID=UPI001D1426A0|nr:toll/interleukin-1 receptor domain-containing protein [Nodosilinea sp. LEGE 07088]
MSAQPLSVFISYSHRDEALKQELEDHLTPLRRQGKILPWHDRDLEAGAEWNKEILNAFDAANIILLLISPRFMSSDFCYGKEMQRAMARHRNGDVKVIPIILTPTDWKGAPFAVLKVLPKDGKPVIEWSSHDAAFLDVVKDIRRAVETLAGSPPPQADGWGTPPPQAAPPQVASAQTPSLDSDPERFAKRGQLFKDLASLPGPQFNQLMFMIKPPPGHVPPDSAPQANRVTALLEWADSQLGPGLAQVESLLTQIVGSPRSL